MDNEKIKPVHPDASKGTEELRQSLRDLCERREKQLKLSLEALLELALKLDEKQRKLDIAQVGFASTGIVAGFVAVVAFGLSFVSFGATLPVAIAGGSISIATGVGGLSATIAEVAITCKTKKAVRKELEAQRILEEAILEKIKTIGNIMVSGVSPILTVVGVAKKSIKIANAAGDVAETMCGAARVSKTFFRSMGTLGKVFHIGGFAFCMVGMAVDIYTLVTRSIKIHNRKPAKAADEIRQLVKELKTGHDNKSSVYERSLDDLEQSNEFSRLHACAE